MILMYTASVKDGDRGGRGFSLEELKEAGLNARLARKKGIPTDVWRRSKYAINIEQLKSIVKTIKDSPPKEKPTPREKPAPSKTSRKTVNKKASKKKQKSRKK